LVRAEASGIPPSCLCTRLHTLNNNNNNNNSNTDLLHVACMCLTVCVCVCVPQASLRPAMEKMKRIKKRLSLTLRSSQSVDESLSELAEQMTVEDGGTKDDGTKNIFKNKKNL